MTTRKALARRIIVATGVILAIAASTLAVRALLEARLADRISGGVRVDGQITEVSAPYVGTRTRVTRLEVSYVYNGTGYTGPLMWLSSASDHQDRFHRGDNIPLYVDPSDPHAFATDEGGYGGSEGWFLEIATLAPGFLIFGLVVVVGARVVSRSRRARGSGGRRPVGEPPNA